MQGWAEAAPHDVSAGLPSAVANLVDRVSPRRLFATEHGLHRCFVEYGNCRNGQVRVVEGEWK